MKDILCTLICGLTLLGCVYLATEYTNREIRAYGYQEGALDERIALRHKQDELDAKRILMEEKLRVADRYLEQLGIAGK